MTDIKPNNKTVTATDMLAELVAIDSVNPDMPNGGKGEQEYSDWLISFGNQIGLETSQEEILNGRSNAILALRPTGATQTLLIDIHLDTVPIGGQLSSLSPVIENQRVYGRGSCDVKGAMVSALLALEELLTDPPQRTSIVLVGTIDEEYLKRGANAISNQSDIAAAIVGEPTDLQPVVAHKGVLRWQIDTIGKAAHTANPELGTNAIYGMIDVINYLRDNHSITHPTLRHPLCGDGTLTVSVISGGIQVNIVPEQCTIDIDRRLLPNEDPLTVWKEIKNELENLCAEQERVGTEVTYHNPFLAETGIETSATEPIVQACLDAASKVGSPQELQGVPFSTDASPLNKHGTPCVVLGPGSIAQAHSAIEYVEMKQVVTCAQLYKRIVKSFDDETD